MDRNPIRVMIVDDHLMVRDGLRVFLSLYDDLEVVAEVEGGQQALACSSETKPDVVLMDMVMPVMDGATATAQLLEVYPDIKVIALTTFSDQETVKRAIDSGAISYMLKDVRADTLAQAIREAYHGRSTLDSSAMQALVKSSRQLPRLGSDLTKREKEVLALLVGGSTNKAIAAELGISQATVRLHVSNILSKLGARNRTEAATLAHQHNLL